MTACVHTNQLWDVTSDQTAVEIASTHGAEAGANALQQHALENYCTDNITVLVARFSN